MLNENLNTQTDDMLSQDSERDKITKALLKERESFKLRPKEEIIEKAKATGTGLLTGTLAIPSDIVTLSSAVASGVAKYSDSPTAMMLKNVLQKAEKEVGREAFDKWFTKTTGIESNPENVDQLIGEIISPTGAFLAPVKTLKKVFAPLKKGVTDFFDNITPGGGGSGGAAVETAGVGQLDQTKKLLKDEQKAITTEAPTTIPPDEFINAPKVDKMSMGGKNTPTGAEQIKKYKELDKTKKYNPDELFEMTGVYKGEDGKFRWEIDTTDAELKNVQTITDAKDGDAFFLSNLLKFDKLYQEYFKPIKVTRPSQVFIGQKSYYNYKPIKNLGVIIKKKDDDGALGAYSPASDKITLYTENILAKAIDDQTKYVLSTGKSLSLDDLYKFRLESTLLHEVQHAIQGREGFTRGSNTENFLRDGYSQDLKTNDALLQNAYNNLIDNFEAEGALPTIRDRDLLNKNVDRIKRAFDENNVVSFLNNTTTFSLVDQVTNDLRRIPMPTTSMTKNIIRSYVEKVKQYHINKKVLDDEYDIAYDKYRDTYGEREARLVQKRFERRLDLKAQREEAIKQGKTPSGDFLSIEKQMSAYEPIPKDMKGVTSAERDRLSKIARTDPITGKVKKRVSVRGSDAKLESLPADLQNKVLTGQISLEDALKSKDTEEVLQIAKSIERTPVKENPALKKIGEITKLRDGTLGSRTPMDKDGLPKNLVRDKDGKPLVLYYGDSGLVYDETTNSFKPSKIPGKLKNKFEPSGRTYEEGKYIGNFATPNPAFASGYAGRRGSVIPIYIIADKVTNIKARSFLDIDKASGKAKRGEVVVGDVGFDAPSTNLSPEARKASVKKYGTEQYAFNRGTQVFSAITGERLTNLPFIKQNIKNRLLNLSKKEEDIMLKNLSPEDRLKYKNIKTYGDETDDFDEKFIDDLFYRYRDIDLKRNLEKREVAKGGDIMKKQMELFDEGGLKDEGNTVDPVSGNDVPPGATQEEVRDDIPAQLSEGEFVFPADVVRYWGLDRLMKMRQEAKAGLARMEAMGQMGNADEATIPDDAPFNPSQDDLPFTMEDLDMEDEKEYNQGGMVRVGGMEVPKPRVEGMQLNQGGVVKAQTGTYVAPGAGTTVTQPKNVYPRPIQPRKTLYMPPSITPKEAPVGGYQPNFVNQQTGGQTGTPSFDTLVGTNPGQYDELRKYVNDSGVVRMIPFKDGKPIYPIPEGFRFVDEEEEKVQSATTTSVKPTTTTVTSDSGGDDSPRVGTTLVGKTGMGVSERINTNFGVQTPEQVKENLGKMSSGARAETVMDALEKARGSTPLGKTIQQVGAALTPGVLAGKMYSEGTLNPMDVLGKIGDPNAKDLNDIISAFGYTEPMGFADPTDPEGNIENYRNSVSQAMYGMDYAEATQMLGVQPSFTRGYAPGQVDPTTNQTYSANGQSTDEFGNVSYSSFSDFVNAMSASSKSGWMGGEEDAKKEAAKGNTKAQAYLDNLPSKKEEDKKPESTQVESDDNIDDTVTKGDTGTPVAGGTYFEDPVADSTDPSFDSNQGGSSGDSMDAAAAGGGDSFGLFNKGGLAKRKPKVKKMKRGGLASKK